jgi:Glycosyl transferase family 2
MIATFVIVVAVLSLIPALNGLFNLALLRVPDARHTLPGVAILIPARDEETTIERCVRAALASRDVDHEVLVLDDGSSDRTRALVSAMAAQDPRVRLIDAPAPEHGIKGKAAACQALSEATHRAYLLFVDADVTLAQEAAARLVPPSGIDLVSGVPRQILHGIAATAIVPMISTLLIEYLPLALARRMRSKPSLAAACGQLLMVRADGYRACGGHRAVGARMHDALHLARRFRACGYATDLVDATPLASCRMYDGAAQVFAGFGKNATEGMARPLALPIWTLLLAGGHLMPLVALPLAALTGQHLALSLTATGLLIAARACQGFKCREPVAAVLLHPLGVFLTLCIQYNAFAGWLLGRRVEWKGRTYAPQL